MIDSQLWRREWFLDLSPEDRLTFLWAITGESQNAAGLYHPEFSAAKRALGFDVKASASRVESSSGRLVYFREADLLWVVNFLKYQACAGRFLLGAVASLFSQTTDLGVILPWVAYNHRILKSFPPALEKLREEGWTYTERGVRYGDRSWTFDGLRSIQDYLALEPCALGWVSGAIPTQGRLDMGGPPTRSQEGAVPAKSGGDPKWGAHLSREQAAQVHTFWVERFDKHARTQFTKDKETKIRARSHEGATFIEARLAVLGCWFDGDRWSERRSNPTAHAFTLIFRSHDKMMQFVEMGRAELKRQGKKLSDDGLSIEDEGADE